MNFFDLSYLLGFRTMRRLLREVFQLGVVTSALVLVASQASAQFDDVRASIKQLLEKQAVPSVAVAVAQDGEIIWEEGFGWADREKRIPATENTMYSLASVTKPITATALMVLVERGLVDLDRPINDYLGAAKLNGRAFDASQATVRRVANHTAGLPVHDNFFYSDEPYRPPARDETIRRYANLVTPPGERWQYSNLGYGLIDYVIERVSKKSFPEFMAEEVFTPLGLPRTSVHISPGLEAFTATRYAPDGSSIPLYDSDHVGGGAVFSSAHDLVRFGMFHAKNHLADQRPILTDASIDEMHRPTATEDSGNEYGIGWYCRTNQKGLRTVAHEGEMAGVATTLQLLLDEKAVVVVLCNSRRSALVGRIANEIIAVLAPDKIEAPDATQQLVEVTVPERLRKKYVGSYDLGVTFATVSEEQGRLAIETLEDDSFMIHQGDGAFVVALNPRMRLTFDVEGDETYLTVKFGETVLRGSRQQPGPLFNVTPELTGVWKGEVSTYERAQPVTVVVRKSGETYVQLGRLPWTVLDQAKFSDGVLRGIFVGDLGTADANRRTHNLILEAKKRGDVLNGSLIAASRPGNRVGNVLTHWIELHRQ